MGRGTQDPVAEFAAAVFRLAQRRLLAQGTPYMDAEDVAAGLAERVITAPDRVLGRYPSPAAFVKASLQTARTDHERANRCQRGEGSRPVIDAKGDIVTRRPRISLDALAGDPEVPGQDAALPGWEDHLVAHLDLEATLVGLDPTTVEIGRAVAAGYTVKEAAATAGCSLDQANRKLRVTRSMEVAL